MRLFEFNQLLLEKTPLILSVNVSFLAMMLMLSFLMSSALFTKGTFFSLSFFNSIWSFSSLVNYGGAFLSIFRAYCAIFA